MPVSTVFAKGQKKQEVRRCIQELGLNTNYGAAKKWFKKNHNASLADATFYHVRKDMQAEAKQLVAPQQKKPFVSQEVQNIVETVLIAQKLVDKLGKEEVRRLIDLL